MPMANKPGRVVTYDEELYLITSYNVTYSCEVTQQI